MKKINCKVFTPQKITDEMLDIIGYKENIIGKKVLENSCGDGQIIMKIVERYLNECKNAGLSLEEIKDGLSRDIHAYEVDKKTYNKCIQNLDELVLKHNLKDVRWSIYYTDYLKNIKLKYYDFVIGNPPYITYRDLNVENRVFIKENFSSCKIGKFDYSYAFIEASYKALKHCGQLVYLIPSNTFKNVFGDNLRKMIKNDVISIYDYKHIKLFDNALTSSAILHIVYGCNSKHMNYYSIVDGVMTQIEKNKLSEKWIFDDKKNFGKKRRFGDYFQVSLSIATLLNEAFVLDDYEIYGDYYLVNDMRIEKDIVKNAYSPRSKAYKMKKKIIYPYFYDKKGKLIRVDEEYFITNYPMTAKYLSQFRTKLDNRKSDKCSKWYEYGRSQALMHLNQEKLLMSTIVTNKVNLYKLKKNDIPYSGLYIVKKSNLSLDKAVDILESKEFLDYVKSIGINANGHSMRITSKDINNYYF